MTWRENWENTVDTPEGDWPQDIRIDDGKMYYRQKLCVPEGLLLEVVKAQHKSGGHLGVDRCTRSA